MATMAGDGFLGKWSGGWNETDIRKHQDVDAFTDINALVTMDYKDGAYDQAIDLTMTIKLTREDGEVDGYMKVTVKSKHYGAWNVEDCVLSIVPERKKRPKMDIETESQDFPGGGLVQSIVVGIVKKNVLRNITLPTSYTILSMTDNQMVLKDLVTQRKANKGKRPSSMTYDRL